MPNTRTPSVTAASAALSAGTSRFEIPGLPRAGGDGQRPAHRAERAVERQLAHQKMLIGRLRQAHRAQNPDSHGQIEPRAFLANIGRRQVDGDGFVGIAEAGVQQRRLDALPALAHRRIGHAHGDKIARRSVVHIHFDVDQVRFNAEDSGGAGSEKGHVM